MLFGSLSSPNQDRWRSLQYFSVYRLLVIVALAFLPLVLKWLMPATQSLFVLSPAITRTLLGYAVFALLAGISARHRRFHFESLMTIQIVGDIFFIVLLGFFSGGAKAGLPLLLLPYLAAAGLLSRGRMTMFHSAVAAVLLLIAELAVGVTSHSMMHANLPLAGFIALAYFAIAWLAHRLAGYAKENELLAEARGVDLAKQEEVNRLVIRDMQDGVLVIDQHARIRHYNQQAQSQLNMDGVLENRPLSEWPFVYQAMVRWVEYGPADVTIQVPGTEHAVTLHIKPIEQARQAGAVIYVQDSRAEQHLAQQLKLASLGRLTANIAHEIRNPLSAITHAADLMDEDAEDQIQRRLLKIIRDNANRLDRIVQDVLQLNKRDRLNSEKLDLPLFLQEFVNDFISVERLPSAWLKLDLQSDSLEVPFDRAHLNQILWNLCRNAVRYCAQMPGSIAISLSAQDDEWQVRVFNDGPPIPAELQVQLFEPFFTTQSTGTGLGLYIARELSSANGATLHYIDDLAGAIFQISGKLN